MLIAIGGLPGTGKSTLAAGLVAATGAVHLAKDVIEASIRRDGITHEQGSWRVANGLLATLADHHLGDGHSVVIDAVLGEAVQRHELRAVATKHDAAFVLVECVCSDAAVHRSRIEGRVRGIDGWPELTWAEVEATRARYLPWDEPDRLVLDAIDSPESNHSALMAHVRLT